MRLKSYISMKFKNILIKLNIIYLNEILIKIHKTALYVAIEKENIEIIKLLLTNENIDINILNVFNIFLQNLKSYY